MIQQTSLEAYEEVKKSWNKRQQAVYAAISILEPATDKEVGKYLNCPINEITPRRGELVKMGKVEAAGTTVQDGRRAITWRTK